jgi:hypothetical protein
MNIIQRFLAWLFLPGDEMKAYMAAIMDGFRL